MESLKDIFRFLFARKKFWLIPVVIFLLVLAIIIVFVGSSAIAPLLYPLF